MEPGLAEYTWQQDRRRTDFGGGVPVQGFGPGGTYTLWLRPAESGKRYTFKGGRAQVHTDAGAAADPQLAALRDQVVRSFASAGDPGWLQVDVAFLDYAAAVLRQNYDLTDADLDLLLDGTGWQDALVRHVLGADDIIERLYTFGPDLIERVTGEHLSTAYEPHQAPPALAWTPPPVVPPLPAPIPPTRAPGRARAFLTWAAQAVQW